MVVNMEIRVGDVITMKKAHPCGSKEWIVLRVGADFRLKCAVCERQVMMPRAQVEKFTKSVKNA